MSTTPNGVTQLTPDTKTPTWVTHAVSLLLVAVPVALSVWKPNGAFTSTAAQAVIVAAGVLAAGVVHLVKLVCDNGLSKAALEKTVSEEEQWVKANYTDLQQTFTGAQKALAAVPGLPERLSGVEALAHQVEAKVEAIPAPEKVSIEQLADLVVPHVFSKLAAAAVAPTAAPVPAPAPGVEVAPPTGA